MGRLARAVTAPAFLAYVSLEFLVTTSRDKMLELSSLLAHAFGDHAIAREFDQSRYELGTSAGYLQAIIDSIEDSLLVIDRDLRIVRVNSAMWLRHGHGRRQLLGQHCYEVSHGLRHPCQAACPCPAKEVFATGKAMRVVHVHPDDTGDGQQRYVEVALSPLLGRNGRVREVVELVRDVTEERRLAERILEANQELLALNAIAATVSQSLDLDTILSSALEKVLELTKAEVGGILLLEPESQTLSYKVYRGLSPEFVRGVDGLRGGEGIAGQVVLSGEPIMVEDISRDSRVTRPVVLGEGLKAFASVPLRSKDKVVGVMNIANRSPLSFSPQQVRLLTAIGNQVGVAVENARLYDSIQRAEELRGRLLQQVISTQEEERRRIARELHDHTSQTLGLLVMQLETLASSLPDGLTQVRSQVEGAKALALDTVRGIHGLVFDLRPSHLDDLGLTLALKSYAESRLKPLGVEFHLETAGQERKLPSQIELAIFRVVQEAIANIAEHAGADTAIITLDFRDGSVVVQVEDDGRGFDVSRFLTPVGTQGLGLLGMRERVKLLGGTLAVKSEPGLGTEIQVEIPTYREDERNGQD